MATFAKIECGVGEVVLWTRWNTGLILIEVVRICSWTYS